MEAAAEVLAEDAAVSYTCDEYPLERNGIALHLDRVAVESGDAAKSILLVYGLTYSFREFDMDYEDYSLVRFLARQGCAVWRMDVAGYGQSGDVEDGFMSDSDCAAEDINAAISPERLFHQMKPLHAKGAVQAPFDFFQTQAQRKT